MTSLDDTRPFAGIEVVEFGQFIAAPFCAQVLAEGGAHVVKVEALEGDPVRQLSPLAPGETRHFVSRNRGKHSLPLDLRHPSARTIIDRLLARADVVLTNFRPGLAAELGLEYESLAPRHPRLVVGNVTGFGRRGPDAMLAGMDLVLQARSGFMAAGGRVDNGVPAAGDSPVADYMCAMTLAFGVASALLRRTRTGRGGQVDVALLMAALVPQNNSMVRVERADGPIHAEARARLAELRRTGRPFAEQSALMMQIRTYAMINIYYRTYATKDAAIAVACVSPGLQKAFMQALGLTDDVGEARGNREKEAQHYAAFKPKVEAVLASKTTAEWKAIFDAAGTPASAVLLPFELLDDEQVRANGFMHDLQHPALGPVRVLAPPLQMDGPGFVPGPATAPFASETRAILGELGFGEAEVERFVSEKVTRAS